MLQWVAVRVCVWVGGWLCRRAYVRAVVLDLWNAMTALTSFGKSKTKSYGSAVVFAAFSEGRGRIAGASTFRHIRTLPSYSLGSLRTRGVFAD